MFVRTQWTAAVTLYNPQLFFVTTLIYTIVNLNNVNLYNVQGIIRLAHTAAARKIAKQIRKHILDWVDTKKYANTYG